MALQLTKDILKCMLFSKFWKWCNPPFVQKYYLTTSKANKFLTKLDLVGAPTNLIYQMYNVVVIDCTKFENANLWVLYPLKDQVHIQHVQEILGRFLQSQFWSNIHKILTQGVNMYSLIRTIIFFDSVFNSKVMLS